MLINELFVIIEVENLRTRNVGKDPDVGTGRIHEDD
jgi:hypothetical protein